MSSILPSWSLQPLNGCSLQASIWASLTKGGTKTLPPDLLETTLLNQGQDWQEEVGGGGGAAKWVLNKLEASEAITLAQPSQHLAVLCPNILPLSTPGAHTPIVAAKYPSALWDAVSGQLPHS